jgi:predicted acylesterase/phospholipase RssA
MGRINYYMAMVAVALISSQSAANEDGKCYAITLSGGGSEGAWEAGVIWGLVNYGDPKDFEWEQVTGISAGAINTAGMVGFRPDQGIENA